MRHKIAKVLVTPTVTMAFVALGAAEDRTDDQNVASALSLHEMVVAEQGLQLELTPKGLELVAQVMDDTALNDLEGEPLPNVEQPLFAGIKFEATGIKAWARFENVSLTTRDGQLQIGVDLRNVVVRAERLAVYKQVLGTRIGSRCQDTEIVLGQDRGLTVRTGIDVTVRDGRVRLNERDVRFQIPTDEYQVHGPSSCSGRFGTGYITRSLVRFVLGQAKGLMEDALESQVRNAMPTLEEALDSQFRQEFHFDIEDVPSLPNRRAVLRTAPTMIQVSDAGLRVVAAVTIEPSGEESMERRTGLASSVRLGSVGLNPKVFTEAFANLYPDGTEYFELDGDLGGDLRKVLTVQSAAAMWPDLNYITTTRDDLRLQIRLADTPNFRADEPDQALSVDLTGLELKVLVHQDGRWRDYFNMSLEVSTGIGAATQDGELALLLAPGSRVHASGRFADGYVPTIDRFEEDVAELIFSSVFDYLYASGPFFKMGIPVFSLGEGMVTAANPQVQYPFVSLDLVQVQ